jgi:single-strand DNA-binding protein
VGPAHLSRPNSGDLPLVGELGHLQDQVGLGAGHPLERAELVGDEVQQVLLVVEERLDDDVVAAGRLPEVRYTEAGIAPAMLRVAVSGRREQEPSFFTVIVWRDQAEHAAQSLSKGSRVVVVGWLQQRTWTAEDSGARSAVEVVAEEWGPSLRWATATPSRAAR